MKKLVAILLTLSFSFNPFAYASYLDSQIQSNKKAQKYNATKRMNKKHKTAGLYDANENNKSIKDPGLITFKTDNLKLPNDNLLTKKIQNDIAYYNSITEGLVNATKAKKKTSKKKKKKSNEPLFVNSHTSATMYGYCFSIVDRIIRANNLDYVTWKIVLTNDTYSFNAYTTEANIIVLNSSIVEMFSHNPSAIAYVIGHELAHQVLGHMSEESFYDNNLKYTAVALMSMMTLGVAGYAVKKIDSKKQHANEFAADVLGTEFLVRAGYDFEKSMEAMKFMQLSVSENSTESYSHPKLADREKNLRVAHQYFLQDWQKEGLYNLYNSQPLRCNVSSDNASIILSSINEKDEFYTIETPEELLKRISYIDYKRGNMKNAIKYFNAWGDATGSYIPYLYASYAYEYLHKKTGKEKFLKGAEKMAITANELEPNNEHVEKQLASLVRL